MINSINALYGYYGVNSYKSNYITPKPETKITKEAEATDTPDDTSALDDAQNSTTSALINYLITGLGEKYETLTNKIASKQNSGSSSTSNTQTSGSNENSEPSTNTNTTTKTGEQDGVIKSAQTLITKLLGDKTIAKKYNSFMEQIYGIGSSSSGRGTPDLSSEKDKKALNDFINTQKALISKSLFADIVNNKNAKKDDDTTATQTTSSENTSNPFSNNQIKNLVVKNKI